MWAPQPGPQTDAITADWCPELFYGGSAGGGKSDYLLGDYLQDVPLYGAAWQGVLFRRTYPELEELIKRSLELFPPTGAIWSEQKKQWAWPSGATLRMRYLERDADVTRYQGHQYTWVGFDELTQWATAYVYNYLRSRLRSAHQVPTKRMRAAGNPGGVGHHWVKAYFVDPWPAGFKPIVDAQTQETRLFIPARLKDNRVLLQADPGYEGRLRRVGSPQLVKALLEGDWSVIEGAFFPEWSTDKHVVTPFTVPADWLRFRSGDWGSAAPFSIGWWAVVGDDCSEPSGSRPHDQMGVGLYLPRGALLCYREWYGASAPNVGLKLPAEEVADGIKLREAADGEIAYSILDPSAFASDGGPSIAERMATRGVFFRRADNARVSRRGAMGGWDQVRARLIGDGERPAIYWFSTCIDSIRTLPALQHDDAKPEDVNSNGEDHAPDQIRYAAMSRPYIRHIEQARPPRFLAQATLDEVVQAQRKPNRIGRV